jgi:hypothetical protein
MPEFLWGAESGYGRTGELGRLGFVVSHPSDKNKYVARMEHPALKAE